MKRNIGTVTVILPLIFWTSCISEEKKLARQEADSTTYVLAMKLDSIQRLSDSLERERKRINDSTAAAEKAYRNRPWKKSYYVDEFGDETGVNNIRTKVTGTFSNSAVSGEILYVDIYVDKNSAGIFLHERSRSSPAEKFIGDGTIRMKNSNSETLTIYSYSEWSSSGGLLIRNKIWPEKYDYSKLISFLKRSVGEIRVVIRDKYSSRYNFTIDATGFTKEFSLL